MFGATVTDDEKYLLIEVAESCDPVNQLYVTELPEDPRALRALCRTEEGNIVVNKLFDTFEAG